MHAFIRQFAANTQEVLKDQETLKEDSHVYKLLIVDDEYWVRRRLVEKIDWGSIGICEVYGAEDGKKALGISIQVEPDIVVTDVNMPGLSGIELMQALNICALCPRFIIISGFVEYEYALSAMDLGAVDYLLKPIDERDLIGTVKKIIEDFRNQTKEKKHSDIKNACFECSMRSIAADIKNYSKSAATQELKRLLDEFLKQHGQNPAPLAIKLFYINVMNVLLKDCLAPGSPSEEFLDICMDSLDEIGTFFTPEKLLGSLQNIVDYLLPQYEASTSGK